MESLPWVPSTMMIPISRLDTFVCANGFYEQRSSDAAPVNMLYYQSLTIKRISPQGLMNFVQRKWYMHTDPVMYLMLQVYELVYSIWRYLNPVNYLRGFWWEIQMSQCRLLPIWVIFHTSPFFKTSMPRQNGRHFAYETFKHFREWNC